MNNRSQEKCAELILALKTNSKPGTLFARLEHAKLSQSGVGQYQMNNGNFL
jgi:hypothetical protein